MEQAPWLQLICDFVMLMVQSGGHEYIAIYLKWDKNMFHTICSCTQSATTQHLSLGLDLICKSHRERMSGWERVHFLVTLGDVMGSQPVPLEYTQLCDTLISHGCDKISCVRNISVPRLCIVFLNKPVKMHCSRILIVTALPKNFLFFFGWWWWWCNSSRLHTFSE